MLPDRKVLAGGLSGLVTWLVVYISGRYGLDIPADVQAAIPLVFGLVVSYLVPPSQRDVLKRLDDGIIAIAARDPQTAVSEALAPYAESLAAGRKL